MSLAGITTSGISRKFFRDITSGNNDLKYKAKMRPQFLNKIFMGFITSFHTGDNTSKKKILNCVKKDLMCLM